VSQDLGGFVWMDMEWDHVLLAEALVRGDYVTFERRWQARLPVYESTALRQWLIGYLYLQARALWMQQRWDDLRQIHDRVGATHIDFEPPESHIARQMMAALSALQEQRLSEAETVLHEVVATQRRVRQSRGFFDARFMLAHLYRVSQRQEHAVAVLRPLLTTLAQEGTPGWILREGRYTVPLLRLTIEHNVQAAFVEQVLGQLSPERATLPIPIPGRNETLTPREAEILNLIVAGASNRDIAEQLVISEWTVKSHVSRILAKFGVASRTEAAARARDLGIT
jgi:DNA-binding CsgD family transcriptional regulator